MLDRRVVGAADAERNGAGNVLDDGAHIVTHLRGGHVEPHGHVAACDIEPDAADADLILVSDDAADRLRITEMPVSHQRAAEHIADLHAIAHLVHGARVVLAYDRERCV